MKQLRSLANHQTFASHSAKSRRRASAVISAVAFIACSGRMAHALETYQDKSAPVESRVNDIFSRLTENEKLSLLTGTDFTSQAIPRLGIRAIAMADAGQGVRGGSSTTQGPATLFPAGVTMGSTWDPAMVGQIGKSIGEEAYNKGTGVQVLLGPAVNIQRSPLGGRNGEYFSEDPFLAGQLAAQYIRDMQSTGVGACVKHFAANNEEVDRDFVNVHVDERTLREIYLPAFESAVKDGKVWTLMSSYNRINGPHATANKYLLTSVLKGDWGYDGLVMSDWGAVHETVGVVNAGNDLEMPGPGLLSHDRVAKALSQELITQASIDESVHRLLRTMIRTGCADPVPTPDHNVVDSPQHRKVAFRAASEGIVLLKNDHQILPIDPAKVKSIALIGPRVKSWQMGANGSPGLTPVWSVSPYDGLVRRAGDAVDIRYVAGIDSGMVGTPIPSANLTPANAKPGEHGLHGEYFGNVALAGKPILVRTDKQVQYNWAGLAPFAGVPATKFSARWTGTLTPDVSGTYTIAVAADDGVRLSIDGKMVIDHFVENGGAAVTCTIPLIAGQAYAIQLDYYQGTGSSSIHLNWLLPSSHPYEAAVKAAMNADMAIVMVGSSAEGEGTDRSSMELEGDQATLVNAIAAANPNTVVVLNNGTPCTMTSWLGKVSGVVEAWFPGEAGGDALASILFGDINPSGKLPTTLAARREDYPDTGNFPGVKGQVTYAEGIYVGYRHFDKHNVAPLFPFGYGLSYTTFKYGPVSLSKAALNPADTLTVSVPITNVGSRAGSEVVELYVHDPSPKVDKAVRELKGFARVQLAAGATKIVQIPLTGRSFAYCDVAGKQWKADAGNYSIEVGASSRDIRSTATATLSSDYTEALPNLGDVAVQSHSNDLAYLKQATASSVEKDGVEAANVTDGDPSTRWSSKFTDPQWVSVDLGKSQTVGSVDLTWEAAYAKAFMIQLSDDGKTWRDVYSTSAADGSESRIKFAPQTARFVRMFGTKRGTEFGYSVLDFEVYAK